MKKIHYLLGFCVALGTLSSCASIQQVADDDVYVTKNPKLSSTEEVNDVSSYENYRFRKNNRLFATRYGKTSGINFSPSVFIAYNYGYSPFNDPFYYPHQYGTVYGNGMYNQYGNYDTYYNPYYNNGYYGNYYAYNNPYNNNWNNNWSTPKPVVTSYNTHYGPRSTFSGVNNYGRGTGSKLGIAKQNRAFGQNTTSSIVQKREVSRGSSIQGTTATNGRTFSKDEVKSSRTVSSGSGLTGTSTRVSTASVNSTRSGTTVNRSTSSESSGSSSSSTRSHDNSWSTSGSSGSSTRSNSSSSGGSTVKSSGSSSGSSSSPRGTGSSGSSSTPRRGGR